MPKKRKVAIDAKNKQVNFFKNDFLEFFKSEINCHIIGRVISYDKAHHRCDVQPLPLQSDGDKRAALTEVVVPDSISMINDIVDFMKWADKFAMTYSGHTHTAPHGETSGPHGPYHVFDKAKEKHAFKVGSVVWVGFCDREMDNWSGRNNYKIDTKRMHSIQDAVIEAVIKP